ncbi:hypothetical protein HaLaN_08204 [Haematococcus lacustris]|uniref:Uncharacterized protein n=1 Tax=Haematococcus lacustris TaxID=44745 RepID=A0A699YRM3_HAELA|nr:hypothetical protein HaLaN_08204 [Haematococcus lacustris]
MSVCNTVLEELNLVWGGGGLIATLPQPLSDPTAAADARARRKRVNSAEAAAETGQADRASKQSHLVEVLPRDADEPLGH